MALACVLLVVFVLYRRGDERISGAESAEQLATPTATSQALVELSDPQPEDVAAPAVPQTEPADTREAPKSEPQRAKRVRTSVIVEGKLRVAGIDEVPASLQLKLLSGGKQIETDRSRPDGTFSLTRSNTKAESRLGCSVQVSNGSILLQEFEVDAEKFVRDEGTETWRARVDFELTDIWIVRGTLLTPEGKAPPQAGLSLVPFDEMGEPTILMSASAESRRDGRFELVAKPEAAQVRLVVQANGYVPLLHAVAPPRSGLVDVGTLTLDRGATISGCVSSSLAPEYRAESVDAWNVERGVDLLPFDSADRVHWGVARAFWGHASAPVGEDGCFEIRGLQPGRYAINPSHQRVVSLMPAFTTQVEAPESNVVVQDSGALIQLRLCDDDGNALSKAVLSTVWLSLANDSTSFRDSRFLTGYDIVRPILVPPGLEFRAAVIVDGFLPCEIAVEGLVDGQLVETTARLHKLPKPRTLSIEVLREDGSVVERAHIRIEIETSGGWVSCGGTESSAKSRRHTISDVPATRVRLSIVPDMVGAIRGSDFSRSIRVELDENSPEELRAVLPSGGVFEISVTDPKGSPVEADFTLMRDGKELAETMFVMIDSSVEGSGPLDPVRNIEPLEAGDYVLRVEHDGFVAQDVPIQIVPKSTVHHAVQLQRAP